MNISIEIVKLLERNNIKHTFGIPASTFAGILDAMNDSDIEYIITKNEAGATYSASKYADLSKNIGVCLLAGGVGVNNAINGIADAQRNKVPMLIINGDVRTTYMGKGALQEFDNAKIVESVCKYSKNITTAEEVLFELQKAIDIALTPPCGPVLISIPYDIQLQNLDKEIIVYPNKPKMIYDYTNLNKAIDEINKCKKGLIFIGRGCRGLSEEIKQLSEKLQWGIISTPNAKGLVETDYPYYIGNYGFCSSDGAVNYVENEDIDCILILGTSLGQSATRDYNDILVKNRKVIRIDFDKKEFDRIFKEDISICHSLEKALPYMIENVSKKENEFIKPEMNMPYEKNHTGISLRLFYEKLPSLLPDNSCVVADVGDFFNYIFKYMPITKGLDFQASVNYACMGAGVAGVMGSYLQDKSKTYVSICGDGGFYMNGNELLTAKEYNMPIIYIVVNNSMLGLVKNGMKAIFGREYSHKVTFEKNSISALAHSMDIDAVQITELEQLDQIKDKLINRTSPLLIEIITDGTEIFIDTDRLKKVK